MTRSAVLAGIGSCLPARRVSNEELAPRLDSSDAWIRSRTGIRQRYYAEPDTATSDLAAAAGARALAAAGDGPVDVVVVGTTTPDRRCPGTAPTVAAKLGLVGVGAYDVSAVCTGFVYGLATAAGLIAAGISERALVIGAETFSTILDPADRATSVIFGDGAGAVVLRAGTADEPGAIGSFDLGSDGSGVDLITVRGGGSAEHLSTGPPDPADQFFSMVGNQVFRQAVERMGDSVRVVLKQAEWTVADIDHLVAHQANQRILGSLADELEIGADRMISNIAEVGNTAGASIPLALDQAAQAGRFAPGDRLVLTAFGGGLTWGSVTLTWPDVNH